MPVGHQPQHAAGLQQGRRLTDEVLTQTPILGPPVVEGRIADDEVQLALGRQGAHIGPLEADARVLDILLRRRDGAPVDVDQTQACHRRRPQRHQRQRPETAAQVGARALQRRHDPGQQGRARIDPIPGEDARLRTGVQPLDLLQGPRRNGRVQTLDGLGTDDDAAAVVSLGRLSDLEAEALQLLAQPRAALVLGRHDVQASADLQRPQRQRQGVAPLHHARRGVDHRLVRRTGSEVFQRGRAGDQGRGLLGAGRNVEHRRRAAIEDRGHGEPIATFLLAFSPCGRRWLTKQDG
ncbi:hypothetical protein D3C72_1320200 [compost metagenome]